MHGGGEGEPVNRRLRCAGAAERQENTAYPIPADSAAATKLQPPRYLPLHQLPCMEVERESTERSDRKSGAKSPAKPFLELSILPLHQLPCMEVERESTQECQAFNWFTANRNAFNAWH